MAMLIYIDNTIAEYLSKEPFNTKQMVFFASIASAYYQGKCVIFGDLSSISALIEHTGKPTNQIFQVIQSHHSQSGSIANRVSEVFVISCLDYPSDESVLPTVLKSKSRYFSIQNAMLLNWSLGSCLLGENISDCKFYESIGRYYCKKEKIRGVQLSFHHEHGGGSGISSVLTKCVVSEPLPTLCLSDADIKFGSTKKYGDPPKGDTFKGVSNTVKHLNNLGYSKRFYFFHMPIHEIENLIPLSLLKCLGNSICPPESIAILEALTNIQNGEPALYYDFKKGEEIDPETAHGFYWNEVFTNAGISSEDGKYREIACESLLERVNEYIEENNIFSVVVDDYLESLWDKIGQLVFTWGCATPPIRG